MFRGKLFRKHKEGYYILRGTIHQKGITIVNVCAMKFSDYFTFINQSLKNGKSQVGSDNNPGRLQ